MEDVTTKPTYMRDRTIRLLLSFDGISSADEYEWASYLLDDAQLLDFNSWEIRSASTLRLLDRLVFRGKGARGRVVRVQRHSPLDDRDKGIYMDLVLDEPGHALPTSNSVYWRIGDEVCKITGAPTDGLTGVTRAAVGHAGRQQLGSEEESALTPDDADRVNLELQQVLIVDERNTGSHFRTQAEGLESSNLNDSAWTRSSHPVDVLLNLLTSQSDPEDGLRAKV